MLIGLGASAIGQLPQGYVQNITPTGDYQKSVLAGGCATTRGFALTPADRLHGFAIEACSAASRCGATSWRPSAQPAMSCSTLPG